MTYNTTEVARILQTPRPRFQDWVNRGYLKPDAQSGVRGKKCGWGTRSVAGAHVFVRLVELGMHRDLACRVMRKWLSSELPAMDGIAVSIIPKQPSKLGVVTGVVASGKWSELPVKPDSNYLIIVIQALKLTDMEVASGRTR